MIEIIKNSKSSLIVKTRFKKLTISKNIPFLFYTFFIFAPLTLIESILAILACPVLTYSFDFKHNYLIVKYNAFSSENEKKYLIDKLKIVSMDEAKNSILLNTDTEISYFLDYFQNKQEALEVINKLKQHICTQAK